MRAWIEQGFKFIKRGGWQWHKSRMESSDRGMRLWLAVSVATLWLLSVGGEIDESIPESTFLDISGVLGEARRQRKATKLRLVSVFRRGWIAIFVSFIRHETIPFGHFIPKPWTEASLEPY